MVWALPLSLAATDGIFSLSFPLVTEMFHFTRFALNALCIHALVTVYYHRRVTPFGHARVIAYLPLTVPYRSLSRPS